ncbi:MAG: CBS domain-containing protein [Ketobacter sp.]|uniref:CBS domain-containing protein n=1 Tax=Ketobacter sp. MCCC 1A13808 TaxID=2602738 RepID=UPI0012EC825D|nr:CBS domain-containing protein [Ketobacter sp. MCCC 1A13808]
MSYTINAITVSDCMSSRYVSFTAQTPVVEAATAMVKNELIGGPVVDANGYLVGWISEQDCLKTVTQVLYFSERVATVSDIMRREVLSVRNGDSVLDLANQMLGQKPKIYPVINEHNKVMGVISRRRILREMCRQIALQ